MEDIKNKIKIFLSRYFMEHELSDNEDIFSLGSINSLFAMQLVMFIEKEFDMRVENEDMNIENFRTINDIIEFVLKKKS